MTCIFGTSDGCSCYVCDSCQKDWDATRAERDRLREYVGRLEAALVRLHEIYAWGVQQNDDDEHETWWKAALECVALGREIAGRKP